MTRSVLATSNMIFPVMLVTMADMLKVLPQNRVYKQIFDAACVCMSLRIALPTS